MKNKQAFYYVIFVLVLVSIFMIDMKFGAKKVIAPTDNKPITQIDGWTVFTDTAKGISFQYPADLGMKYIRAADWPPLVSITKDPFTCTEGGVETDGAGMRKIVTIGANTYCVSKLSQGAAGSTYNSYIYINEVKGQTRFFVFTLQYPQCDNYDEPSKSECKTEQNAFDVNSIVDKIFSTLVIK